jgi:hypothetical protein
MSNTNEQQTLLETIKIRLERNDNGVVSWVQDENGPYSLVPRIDNGLVRYFKPAYEIGIDAFGNIKDNQS